MKLIIVATLAVPKESIIAIKYVVEHHGKSSHENRIKGGANSITMLLQTFSKGGDKISIEEAKLSREEVQWNLSIKDTLGPGNFSTVERLSTLQR